MILSRTTSLQVFATTNKPKPPRQPLSLPVFQACKYIKPPSTTDVYDALVTIKNMKFEDAEDYCLSIGINYRNAVMYHDVVDYLDRCLRKS